MKIIVFSPYYPPHVGGLESHAQEFNRFFGEDITVFTPKIPTNSKCYEKEGNKVKVIRYPALEIIHNYPVPCFWKKEFWKLIDKVNMENYDWVVSRTRFFLTSFIAGIYAKTRKIKWLHVEHGSDYVKLNNKFFGLVAKVYDHSFGRWVLASANEVVANSRASRDFCKKLYSKRNYKVIYRGVDVTMHKIPKGGNKVEIVYAGRLIDGKGVNELIEALMRVSSKNWHAIIVGDGPRKNEWIKKAKGLSIDFVGEKSRKDVWKIMANSNIVVNPSFTEGIPTTVIEGALMKKAIIATDVGGTCEVITQDVSGLLYQPHDINTLIKLLDKLISDEKLRLRLGNKAHFDNKSKFNWSESVKKYKEFIK